MVRLAVAHPPAWHAHAACAGHNPSLWYPPTGGDGDAWYADSKAICADCPSRLACLTDVLDREGSVSVEYRWGLWGGLTPEERARLAGSGTR